MILAVHNPKGGSGKTTTAVNVAAVLARMNRAVLLVDLDTYAAASISLGVHPAELRPSIADVLVGRSRAQDAARAISSLPNLHILTGAPALARIDQDLYALRQPERRLADVLRPLNATFDDIVVDASSGHSLITRSVPVAAQHLVVPVTADYLPLDALAQFLRAYRDQRARRKGLATLLGIVLTNVDPRLQAAREIVEIVRRHNRDGVFRTQVPRDPRATEAPSHGMPLVHYAPSSRAADAYRRLTDEILLRLPKTAR